MHAHRLLERVDYAASAVLRGLGGSDHPSPFSSGSSSGSFNRLPHFLGVLERWLRYAEEKNGCSIGALLLAVAAAARRATRAGSFASSGALLAETSRGGDDE